MPALPYDEPWFLLLSGVLVGMVLGSFITMLSYRVPRGISVVQPPSSCPACHEPLTPFDLVPIFSWLLSRGHCRHCGTLISSRYILIEIITTLSCLFAFMTFGLSIKLIIALVGLTALITLVVINLERARNG